MMCLARQAQQQRVPTDLPCSLDANKQQRQLIAELESKNRLELTAPVKPLRWLLFVSSSLFQLENKGMSAGTNQTDLRTYL